jgi:hypothetical protein
LLAGCATPAEPVAEPPAEDSAAVEAPARAQNNSVQPTSPAAGGMSPVTNPQAVQGSGGGGVGQAAKDQARRNVGGTAPSSLDQLGDY